MKTDIIATAYLPDGVNRAFPTVPGQTLKFMGGKAEVKSAVHMPTLLKMPNARVTISHEWKDWLPEWVEQCGFHGPQASITIEDEEGFGVAKQDMSEVTFGRHPVGHQCRFCERARAKAAKALVAE